MGFKTIASLVVILTGVFSFITKGSNYEGLVSYTLKLAYQYLRYLSVVWDIMRFFLKYKLPAHYPVLPQFTKLSEHVYQILGQNPGFHTLQGTNTYLITGGNGYSTSSTMGNSPISSAISSLGLGGEDQDSGEHILIDTGESFTSSKYISVLFDTVFPMAKTKRLSVILLTHGHADHTGGVKAILNELKQRKMLPLPLIYKRNIYNGKHPVKGFDTINIEEDHLFPIDSKTSIQAIYTPGHTDDHVSFLFKGDSANSIIAGDCILGCGTTVFEDLAEYMNSLVKLRDIVSESQRENDTDVLIDRIYPGHGPAITTNALGKIEEYIEHRMKRETQLLSVLSQQKHMHTADDKESGHFQWSSSLGLVPKVYGKLSMGLILSAQSNLLHHLKKLKKEGRVEQRWPDLWRLNPDASRDDSLEHISQEQPETFDDKCDHCSDHQSATTTSSVPETREKQE
jgi:ribonuclease/clavin/mitogillin